MKEHCAGAQKAVKALFAPRCLLRRRAQFALKRNFFVCHQKKKNHLLACSLLSDIHLRCSRLFSPRTKFSYRADFAENEPICLRGKWRCHVFRYEGAYACAQRFTCSGVAANCCSLCATHILVVQEMPRQLTSGLQLLEASLPVLGIHQNEEDREKTRLNQLIIQLLINKRVRNSCIKVIYL